MALKHFIDTQDFSKAELLEIIQLTSLIKAADKRGCTPKLLADATDLINQSKRPVILAGQGIKHAKAHDELVAAQKELKELLTARQEAVLVSMGMLD